MSNSHKFHCDIGELGSIIIPSFNYGWQLSFGARKKQLLFAFFTPPQWNMPTMGLLPTRASISEVIQACVNHSIQESCHQWNDHRNATRAAHADSAAVCGRIKAFIHGPIFVDLLHGSKMRLVIVVFRYMRNTPLK